MAKLNDQEQLYVRSMGKLLRVTAMFYHDEAANAYMGRHRDQAVVAVFDPFILLADVHDKGIKLA